MHRFFGSTKKAPTPTIQDAITSVDGRIDSVEVKLRKLDAELLKYREQMSKMRNGPAKDAVKQRALRVLQQKKMYEGQRDQLQQQVFNMEQASMTTDNLKHTATTVEALKATNKQLKQQYKSFNIDKIESLQDELEDLMEQANDLQESLSRSYAVPDDMNEVDLDAELEALGDDVYNVETTPSYLDAISTGDMPELEPLPEQPPTKQSELDEFGLPVQS
jgi:charged multivesicular body protein 5